MCGDFGCALTSKLHILNVDLVDLVLHPLNLAINCLLLRPQDLCLALRFVNLIRNRGLTLLERIGHLLIDLRFRVLKTFDLVLDSGSLVFHRLIDLVFRLLD